MATCRLADRRPLAPLADFLKGITKREIQLLMTESMPILAAPNLKKEQLIDELIGYVEGAHEELPEVCKRALKGLKKDYLHMILLQYDPNAAKSMLKSSMIDLFIDLCMPRSSIRDDGPCMAIVPYTGDCGARAADFPGQLVDFDKSNRKLIKTKKRMMKRWLKGARLIRRKLLSSAIVAELKLCLRPCRWRQWTVESLRDHVSSVVGTSLHGGHGLIFFHKKLQQLMPRRCRKRHVHIHKGCAVPNANFTVIADPVQFRELKAMRRQDVRA